MLSMLQYDEALYQRVAQKMHEQKSARSLVGYLSDEQLLNHISTVFYADRLAIAVGQKLPEVQALMSATGIGSLAGLTPKFPIFNPDANEVANAVYVRYFRYKLTQLGQTYIPCFGRARDFREGGDGCFLLPNVSPDEVMQLLAEDGQPTQLSFTYLQLGGKGQLISCIENAAHLASATFA